MKSQTIHDGSTLPVRKDFIAGVDVGGTKVHIADTLSTTVHRYETVNYSDLYTLLGDYFAKMHAIPDHVTLAIAGPRNAETGEVEHTNLPWPSFNPAEAARRFPGTTFETVHDLTAVAAGILKVEGLNFQQLKSGRPVNHGTKIAVTISTGVGVDAAVWDQRAKQYTFVAGEAGHLGFQPYNEAQERHLKHLFTKYKHPSIELAISGKHGVESWIEHSPEMHEATELAEAIERAKIADQPVGAVLLAFATEGSGKSQEAAKTILGHMGALVGNVLADIALAYLATGGVYLTGSVSLGLAEYWAAQTDFNKAFVRSGTKEHAAWLEDVLSSMPIYLITDPNIGATGALALAEDM